MVEHKIKWQLIVSRWWTGADWLIRTVKCNENKF